MASINITETDYGFRLKPSLSGVLLSIPFFALVCWKVVPTYLQMFSQESDPDYTGIIFMSIWLLFALYFFYQIVIKGLTTKLELTDEGIFYTGCFRKHSILWCELKDYGLSYRGSSKNGRKQYTLYFSEEILPEKNHNKKKLRGVVIKLDLNERDYASIMNRIVPFCQRYCANALLFLAE